MLNTLKDDKLAKHLIKYPRSFKESYILYMQRQVIEKLPFLNNAPENVFFGVTTFSRKEMNRAIPWLQSVGVDK